MQADDRPDHLRWQGKAVEFMRSNQHSKSRDGRWDLDGLEGAVREIVAGDQSAAKYVPQLSSSAGTADVIAVAVASKHRLQQV